MNFTDRLMDAIDRKGTPAIIGIDPRTESLPRELAPPPGADAAVQAQAFLEFSRRIVDVVAPLVPAVKPNVAFFEALGWEGFRAYEEIVAHARDRGLLVVADMKRGDIGSTAEAYARGVFDRIGADAVTLSPWLGEDSLKPFFEHCADGKGCFLLVKTSNPSSRDLQDQDLGGRMVFDRAAELTAGWGEQYVGERGFSAIGAVVGATFPEQAAALREAMPRTPFLLPGYGAQGGKAESLRHAFAPGGAGAIVNSSRGIIFAHAREPWATECGEEYWEEAVRRATLAMKEDLAGAVPDATWAGSTS